MISGIHFPQELKKVFQELGFTELTDIQKKVIPVIQQGRDVIGQSKTGSGKTLAFGFPLLEKIIHKHGIQALILVPTRELCVQVSSEMVKFSRYKRANVVSVYGGVSINPQIDNLRFADIVVGTPGRILDHLQRGTLNLSKVNVLILDEADKMFEMGFIDDVRKIISQIPHNRQTLLFSATISSQVESIVRNYMKNPFKVKTQSYVEHEKLVQHYYPVEARDKFSLFVHLLKTEPPGLTLIFCATRRMVDVLSKNLYKQGIRSQAIHGGLTQNRRTQAINMFQDSKTPILVATDVAARGLDIQNVKYVINYDLPKTSQEYIHRIGRTARAGKGGRVISLLSHMDHENFRRILADRSLAIEKKQTPQFERVSFVRDERRGRDAPQRWQRAGGSSYHGRSSHGGRREGRQERSEGRGRHPQHSRGERSAYNPSKFGVTLQRGRR